MGGRRLVIVVGAAVALGVAERDAEACICSGASSLVAPTTAVYPRGASIVLATQCSGALDAWSVTLDGEPAVLVGEPQWVGVQPVAVEPAPKGGAEVVISQSCEYDVEATGCLFESDVVERARFTVASADVVAPAVADDVGIDVEHGEFGESCDEPTHDLRFAATIRFPSIEPAAWAQIVFSRDTVNVRSETHEIPATGEIATELIGDAVDYSGSEVCVEAMAIDASGNASDWRYDCIVFDPQPLQTVNECTLGTDARPGGAAFVLLVVACRRRRR
jgi:hypothetical protein